MASEKTRKPKKRKPTEYLEIESSSPTDTSENKRREKKEKTTNTTHSNHTNHTATFFPTPTPVPTLAPIRHTPQPVLAQHPQALSFFTQPTFFIAPQHPQPQASTFLPIASICPPGLALIPPQRILPPPPRDPSFPDPNAYKKITFDRFREMLGAGAITPSMKIVFSRSSGPWVDENRADLIIEDHDPLFDRPFVQASTGNQTTERKQAHSPVINLTASENHPSPTPQQITSPTLSLDELRTITDAAVQAAHQAARAAGHFAPRVAPPENPPADTNNKPSDNTPRSF